MSSRFVYSGDYFVLLKFVRSGVLSSDAAMEIGEFISIHFDGKVIRLILDFFLKGSTTLGKGQ